MQNPIIQTRTSNQQPIIIGTAEPAAETKMMRVFCDLCDETMHATKANLHRYGWGIYAKYCFCPFHEDEI